MRFGKHKLMGHDHRVGCITRVRVRGRSMVVVGAGAGRQRGARATKMRKSADFYSLSADFMPCQHGFSGCHDANHCFPRCSQDTFFALCSMRSDVLHDRISLVRRSWKMLCHGYLISYVLIYRMHRFSWLQYSRFRVVFSFRMFCLVLLVLRLLMGDASLHHDGYQISSIISYTRSSFLFLLLHDYSLFRSHFS